MALKIFRSYDAIKAVYLCRGGAKGEILPLVSDIDFTIIEKGMNEEDREDLIDSYERLVRITTILDQNIEIHDPNSLFGLYDTNDYFQYRFTEGKKTWKLLLGKDYLADLPELPMEKMFGGFFTEIKVWWSLFAWRFFQSRKYNDEFVTRNNVCYKTVSEILKMNLALNHNLLIFDRKRALRTSKLYLPNEALGFLKKVDLVENSRFRLRDRRFLEETKNFILGYLNHFFKDFLSHSYAKPLNTISQHVDCPLEESFCDTNVKIHLDKLIKFLKNKWDYTYQGAFWAQSAYFNMDEILFMVKVDAEKIPTIHDLTTFYLYHNNAPYQLTSRIRLFLLFPNAAFQIDPYDSKKSWQSILCPPCNPELFELISRLGFCLDGNEYTSFQTVEWTPLVKHFFWEEKRLFYDLFKKPEIYKLNSLDFLRIFWKTAQLVVMNRSVNSDQLIYPLTIQAVERGLEKQEIPVPTELQFLSQAYSNELAGNECDISDFVPSAIEYLVEINK